MARRISLPGRQKPRKGATVDRASNGSPKAKKASSRAAGAIVQKLPAKKRGGRGELVVHDHRGRIKEIETTQVMDLDIPLDVQVLIQAAGLNSSYSTASLAMRAERGVPVHVVEVLTSWIPSELVYKTIASPTTVHRRLDSGLPLLGAEAERALRMVSIVDKAVQVFGDPEKAKRWLSKPKQFLDPSHPGRSPYELLESEYGARVVEERLGQIEHGIFA